MRKKGAPQEKMNKSAGIDGQTKEMMRRLAAEGAVLTDYDWSDVQNGLIEGLCFDYKIGNGEKGKICLGNIPVDIYCDGDGEDDVVADTMGELYVFEPVDGITENIGGFSGAERTRLERTAEIKTDFDWDGFYSRLTLYYRR
jgi:hypothetical protein